MTDINSDNINQFALTQANINTVAEVVASLSDGDYILVFKSGALGLSRIEKSMLFSEIAGSGTGGGMSDEVYRAIKDNVEALRSVLYPLVKTWLANLAFVNGRPSDALLSEINEAFDWPNNGGGETPTPVNPSLLSPALGTSINVGTIPSVSATNKVSKSVFVKGKYLTQPLSISINSEYEGFSVSTPTISAENAKAGTDITIEFTAQAEIQATAELVIYSSEVGTNRFDVTAARAATGTCVVTLNLTNIRTSDGETTYNVQAGQNFSKTLIPSENYELPSANSLVLTGNYGSVSLVGRNLTISTVTSDISVTAAGVPVGQQDGYIQTDLVLHLDGENRGNSAGHWIDTKGSRDFALSGTYTEDPVVEFSTLNQTKRFNGVLFDGGVGTYTPNGDDDAKINRLESDDWTIEVAFTPVGASWKGSDHGIFSQEEYNLLCAVFYHISQSAKLAFSTANSSSQIRRNVDNLLGTNAGEPFMQGLLMRISMTADALVVNGQEIASATSPLESGTLTLRASNPDAGKMRIGQFTNSSGSIYNGKSVIHEVRIYSSKLNAEQMIANQTVDEKYLGTIINEE